MRIYNSGQRVRIYQVTSIDPFIIDRVCEAYQCLVERDDVAGYRKNLLDAMAQQGLPPVVPPEERPTAVDRMKSLAVASIAKQWNWDYSRVAKWVEDATKP